MAEAPGELETIGGQVEVLDLMRKHGRIPEREIFFFHLRGFDCWPAWPVPLLPAGDGDVVAGGVVHVHHVLHVRDAFWGRGIAIDYHI